MLDSNIRGLFKKIEYQIANLKAMFSKNEKQLLDNLNAFKDENEKFKEYENYKLDKHLIDQENPHKVTKEQVGLGLVDNIKQASSIDFENHVNAKNNPHAVTKSQVGLGNVDNIKQASKADFDSHVNYSQNYRLTADDGKHLITVPANGSIFDTIRDKGTCTFYAPSGIGDSPAPSNSALRGIQTVGQNNIGTGFAVDTSGNAYYFYYNSGHTSITWTQLPTATEKDKWNSAQLAKLTLDNGRVFYRGSAEVTDYDTVTQTGLYLIYNAGVNGPPSFNRVFMLVMSYGNTLAQIAYESFNGKQVYFRFRKSDSETWLPWERQLTTPYLDVAWQKPTLQPSWKQYVPADGSIHTVRFSKNAEGVVEIKGAVYGGVLGLDTPVFTLPTGYRPMQSEYFSGIASSIGTPGVPQFHRTFIGTDGRVCIQSSSNPSNPVEFLSFGFRFSTK